MHDGGEPAGIVLVGKLNCLHGQVGKSWWRIWTRGKAVDLPVWQRPGAMLVSFGFYGVGLAGEIKSALTRSFEPLPPPRGSNHQARVAA